MEIERSDAIVARVLGRIGNTIYTRKGKKAYVARGTYKGEGPSEKEKDQRFIYQKCDLLWGSLTEKEKDEWKKVTYGKGHTRYSTFMHVNLKRGVAGKPLKPTP